MAWEKLITNNATVYDTLRLIIRTVNEYAASPFVQQVTTHIIQKYPNDFLRGIFDFVCDNVNYTKDKEGHEYVSTPQRTFRDGKGDCKKMSTFISAVLLYKGIKNYLRIVSYDGNSFAHIYVIVPDRGGYITLDPVNNCRYNAEVTHVRSETYNLQGQKMNLSQLGRKADSNFVKNVYKKSCVGIGELDDDLGVLCGPEEFISKYIQSAEMDGMDDEMDDGMDDGMDGKKKKKKKTPEQKAKKKAKRKEKRKKILNKVKKVGLAPGRAAFLLMVSKNVLQWGSKLATAWNANSQKVAEFWKKLGGDSEKLKAAIAKGSKEQISGLDDGLGAAAAVTATTALPVIIAVLKFLKETNLISKKDAVILDKGTSEVEDKPETPGDDTGGDGTQAGSMWWIPCWTNPIAATMNFLRLSLYMGADTQVNGPISKLFHIIKQLF